MRDGDGTWDDDGAVTVAHVTMGGGATLAEQSMKKI